MPVPSDISSFPPILSLQEQPNESSEVHPLEVAVVLSSNHCTLTTGSLVVLPTLVSASLVFQEAVDSSLRVMMSVIHLSWE